MDLQSFHINKERGFTTCPHCTVQWFKLYNNDRTGEPFTMHRHWPVCNTLTMYILRNQDNWHLNTSQIRRMFCRLHTFRIMNLGMCLKSIRTWSDQYLAKWEPCANVFKRACTFWQAPQIRVKRLAYVEKYCFCMCVSVSQLINLRITSIMVMFYQLFVPGLWHKTASWVGGFIFISIIIENQFIWRHCSKLLSNLKR